MPDDIQQTVDSRNTLPDDVQQTVDSRNTLPGDPEFAGHHPQPFTGYCPTYICCLAHLLDTVLQMCILNTLGLLFNTHKHVQWILSSIYCSIPLYSIVFTLNSYIYTIQEINLTVCNKMFHASNKLDSTNTQTHVCAYIQLELFSLRLFSVVSSHLLSSHCRVSRVHSMSLFSMYQSCSVQCRTVKCSLK